MIRYMYALNTQISQSTLVKDPDFEVIKSCRPESKINLWIYIVLPTMINVCRKQSVTGIPSRPVAAFPSVNKV